MKQTILIASDHAGLPLKKFLIEAHPHLSFEDLGTTGEDSVDYPDFAHKLARKLHQRPNAVGILVCGSGQGMAMAANKHPHIRAALCWTEEIAQLSREHNDANVLCLGSRVLDHSVAHNILKIFLETPFAGGRHGRRVDKIEGV